MAALKDDGNFKHFKTELTYNNSPQTLEKIVMRDRRKNICRCIYVCIYIYIYICVCVYTYTYMFPDKEICSDIPSACNYGVECEIDKDVAGTSRSQL
jgi:hypothetical protein